MRPGMLAPMSTQSPTNHAIIHPLVDTFAVGGLSIAFLIFLLLFEPGWSEGELAERFIVLTALLNWPHFMATYALMYRSRDTVQRYPMASKWMPLAIAVTCTAAVLAQVVSGYEGSLKFLTWMAGAYLAWHYTGQTWGMMASFSFLTGHGFKDEERKIIRIGLDILLVWHLIWFFHVVDFGGPPLKQNPTYLTIYSWATYLMIPVGALLGFVGLWRYRKRIEKSPSPRVTVPFLAIVLWYVSMAINPLALFWVQLSHSLQYLLFPMRVEINRGAARERSPLQSAVLFAMIALGLGVLLFELFPRALNWAIPAASLAAVKLGIGNFINIHHYFADSVIWKISNPAVRKELFAHIKRG